MVTEVPVKTGQLSLYGSKVDGVCLFVHSGTLIVREKKSNIGKTMKKIRAFQSKIHSLPLRSEPMISVFRQRFVQNWRGARTLATRPGRTIGTHGPLAPSAGTSGSAYTNLVPQTAAEQLRRASKADPTNASAPGRMKIQESLHVIDRRCDLRDL